MTVHANPLVDDYLRRLNAAAAGLPPHRRDELVTEIRDHLEEALRQTPASDELAVRNVLERLGTPEDIVEAATESPPSGQLVGASRETNGSAIVSLLLGLFWLAGIGSVLAIIFGYQARREIKDSGGSQKGSALATAGIVLGWIGIAMLLVTVAGGLGLMAFSSSGDGGPATVVPTS